MKSSQHFVHSPDSNNECPVDMYILSTLALWAGGLYISSVDFGCFSTVYRDCEALKKREDQFELHAFIVYIYKRTKKDFAGMKIKQ